MRRCQMTKEQRQDVAIRSEEILIDCPNIHGEGLAHRVGLKSKQHLNNIRQEFGCLPLKRIPGRKR